MEQAHTAAETQVHPYPVMAENYGIVIDDRLDSALIKIGLKLLAIRRVDLLVFLCLAPHDIRQRADWQDLRSHIHFTDEGDGRCQIRHINSPEELLEASLEMKILQLPTSAGYSLW